MDNSELKPESGRAVINGAPLKEIAGVTLDARTLEIHLRGREYIRIYAFNSLMLPIESKRIGLDEYEMLGPKLGMYRDTADIREGPYINHYIDQLSISIAYYSDDEAWFNIKGKADLSKSSFDSYWHRGATSGEWRFEVAFVHKFKASK